MLRLRAIWLVLALFAATSTSAQDRFALVIGNGNYTGASALKNPPNDAAAVAAALEKLDFQVTQKIDADLVSLETAVVAFRKSLTKKSIVLFFYAGHGLQVKGENYLVPVDADVQEEFQVKRKCFPVEELLSGFEESNAALKIVILDSCRDNPLTRGWSRNAGSGLASIAQIPDGTLIAFSTAPGKTALDGRGANSPFTQHLVANLNRRPAEGLELINALRETGQAVSKEIGQRPWLNFDTSLENFYLWRDPSTAPLPRLLKRIEHSHDLRIESVENSIGMKFALVPAGEFLMGSPDDEKDAEPDEKPRHRVKISRSFYMGLHEVTLGQFLRFYHEAKYKTDAERHGGWGRDEAGAHKHGSEFVPWVTGFKQTMNHPAVNISWNDAQAFCKWLSEREGLTYRLPTEAEWEYACRGGTKTRYQGGDDPETLAKVGNVADGSAREKYSYWATIQAKDGFVFTAPVGSFRPNAFGLYDLHGNAWEWCQDGYEADAFTRDPQAPGGEPATRVVRGGAWADGPWLARSACRGGLEPGYLDDQSGFRVVLVKSP